MATSSLEAPILGLPEGVLYDDPCVRLTQDSLVIKYYFFPTFWSKTIPLAKIKKVCVRAC
jgi:hypothetical protein